MLLRMILNILGGLGMIGLAEVARRIIPGAPEGTRVWLFFAMLLLYFGGATWVFETLVESFRIRRKVRRRFKAAQRRQDWKKIFKVMKGV